MEQCHPWWTFLVVITPVYSVLNNPWYWDGMYNYTNAVKFADHVPSGLFRREEEWNAAFTSLCKGLSRFLDWILGFASTDRTINMLSFFQDYFTNCKWPNVFAIPDRIVELLTKEVILFCGVPEVVLMDVVIYTKPIWEPSFFLPRTWRAVSLTSHLLQLPCHFYSC